MLSCKTTTEPIKYDKNLETITKEAQVIQFLINNGNYDKAKEKIDKILQFYPDNIDIIELKGWLYIKTNKLQDAEKIFNELLTRNNKNPHAYAALARIYRILGDKEKAEKMVDKGLDYLPTISLLWLEKGIIEYESEDYKKALVDFNKSYTFDNNNIDAYFFKYITMLKLGRDLDEIKYFWNKITTNRLYKNWYFLYHSSVLYDLGLKEMALQVSENGLVYYPDDPYLLNITAYLYYDKYMTDKNDDTLNSADKNITKCLEKAVVMKPEFIDTYFLILEAKNDNKKLLSEVNKYVLIFPDSPLLLKWLKKYGK
jgi:tetratricopeptide (TPR) repeat protein